MKGNVNKLTPLGTTVIRLASKSDYTAGRSGEIIEMVPDYNRARVRWTIDPKGNIMTPIRTWVNWNFLMIKE